MGDLCEKCAGHVQGSTKIINDIFILPYAVVIYQEILECLEKQGMPYCNSIGGNAGRYLFCADNG